MVAGVHGGLAELFVGRDGLLVSTLTHGLGLLVGAVTTCYSVTGLMLEIRVNNQILFEVWIWVCKGVCVVMRFRVDEVQEDPVPD